MKRSEKSVGLDAKSGFTLIELLIVIVIIGILAGVLIAVINPFRQQNRARNASVKASITKVAFAINTARAGIGRLPSSSELPSELENITALSDCTQIDTLNCRFSLSGTVLPATCDAGRIAGDASTGQQCLFGISVLPGADLVSGMFRITAKQYKLDPADVGRIFVFDYSQGLFSCPSTASYTTVDLVATCTPVTD